MENTMTLFNIFEYEKQSFEQRVQQGLLMDRSTLNLFHIVPRMGFGNDADKMNGFKDMGFRMLYEDNRQHPGYRRKINARLVNSSKVHKQIVNAAKPILLDIFMESTPTDKDWKNLSEILGKNKKSHDKTIRRRKTQYQDLVAPLPKTKKNLSGKDKRPNPFITSYSQPSFGKLSLDTRNYVDYNYFIRLKKFWKDVLLVLEEILDKFGLRKEMDWFVHHIVNNDVGLHVLFDDLSLERELCWFKTLKTVELKSLSLPLFGIDQYPFTSDDAKKGISELKNFIEEFDKTKIPSALCSYKISQKTMRKRMYEIALYSADGYHTSGNLPYHELIMNEIDKKF